MSNGPKRVFTGLKKRLRGTPVHRVHAYLKYDLPIVLRFAFTYALKQRGVKKIGYSLKLQMERVFRELPNAVAIDIVSCCNLSCPLCSVPSYITKRDNNFMPLETFRRIVAGIRITDSLSLVYAGEPFLHPQFFIMVEHCKDRYFTTTITNGTLLREKNIERLLVSGLDFLQISFDGFSKESYERYRVGADFDSVKRNIKNFLAKRKEKGSLLPHTTITYLITAFNEDEVDACRRYFLAAGADRFFAKAINLNVHRRTDNKTQEDLAVWLPKKSDVNLYEDRGERLVFKKKEATCSICLTPIIRCDGEVLLCCHDIFNTVKIGNALKQDFNEIWFSDHYRKMRRLARERKLPVCGVCGK